MNVLTVQYRWCFPSIHPWSYLLCTLIVSWESAGAYASTLDSDSLLLYIKNEKKYQKGKQSIALCSSTEYKPHGKHTAASMLYLVWVSLHLMHIRCTIQKNLESSDIISRIYQSNATAHVSAYYIMLYRWMDFEMFVFYPSLFLILFKFITFSSFFTPIVQFSLCLINVCVNKKRALIVLLHLRSQLKTYDDVLEALTSSWSLPQP